MSPYRFVCAFLIAVVVTVAVRADTPGEIRGDWEGFIDYQDEPLAVRLHVRENSVGVDYPQLVFADQPATLSGEKNLLEIDLPMMGNFELVIREGEITGERVTAAGDRITLRLTRAEPFVTSTEEIRFGDNEEVGSTLTLPPGDGPFPVAILLAGAGNPTRTNLSYTSWADHLARHGIAALAYDRRLDQDQGIDGKPYDIDAHADDIVSAIDELETHRAIDRDEIYLIAKSRGGWIATATAARDPRVSAIVGIGIAAVSIPQQDFQAVEARMRHDGNSEEDIQRALAYTRLYFSAVAHQEMWPALARAAEEAGEQEWGSYVRHPETPGDLEWFRAQLGREPLPLIRRVDAPMFLAWGSEDRTTPPSMNLPLFDWLISPAVREESILRVYEGAGHTLEGPLNVDDDPEIVWVGMNPLFLDEVTRWLSVRKSE